MADPTKAGIIAIAGKPNVGKSTLLNRLIGQKLAIVSPKAQSTRKRVIGLHSTDKAQMVFVDTPGLLDPRYALQRAMRREAIAAIEDADLILYLVDATEGTPASLERTAGLPSAPRAPVLLVANKADRLNAEQQRAFRREQPEALLISAASGLGLPRLLERLEALLPHGPFLYPSDEASSQSVRFFVLELIRETAFELLSEELPYSVAAEIDEFREESSPVYIRATLYVERKSQQPILVGAGGRTIRALGTQARKKIERLIESPVFLDLHVKVLPNWRRNAVALRRLGFQTPEDHKP